MTLEKDIEGNEKKYLHQSSDFSNRRVLEVWCGEGRLTWQYAQTTHSTIAFDSDFESLRVARADTPTNLRDKVHFIRADAEHIPVANETFDRAVLAWSF